MNLHEDINHIRKMMGLITEAENFTLNLKLGSNNDEVKLLQNLLKINETGEFDDETDECTKEFQTFSEIKIDGVVGPETRDKLQELIDGELKGWLGCKKTPIKKPESLDSIGGTDSSSNKSSIVTPDKIVGSEWRSCKAWRSKGGMSKYGDKFKIVKNSTGFMIGYNGPSSGLSIAHAGNGGDTIHQVYNVLICEMNPFLAQGGLKPNINGIKFETAQQRGSSQLNIYVPITKGDGVWQLDRRGGWGHDPGSSKMEQKCKKITKDGKECIGPVQKIATGPYGKITEYFVTHQI
jgi:hypothetical protein